MATKALDVGSWLAELHMECYKKNLEDFGTIKPLLELRETDIKKLGVTNSKDRSRMMTSLNSYRAAMKKSETTTPLAGPVGQTQEAHKSLLRKGSLKKLNIKSFLSSGSSKKNKSSKKLSESVQVTEVSLPDMSAEFNEEVTTTITSNSVSISEIHPVLPASPPPPALSSADKSTFSSIADYEELPDVVSPLVRSMTVVESTKPFQVPRQNVVENEYVPSPENSPKFNSHRLRANTVADYHFLPPHRGGVAPYMMPSQHSTPELPFRYQSEYSEEGDSPGQLTHKHLSIVSMESGLSFGYDVEKDFNPSQPLETQPWFHGKVARADAEGMLHEDGDFLVRENTMMSDTYTLTLRWRGVADHTLIGTTEVISTTSTIKASNVKYQFDSGAFDSIPELIYNHLKYQIPIDKDQHTLIINPVCRGNPSKGGMFSTSGGYTPVHSHRSNLSPESSPLYTGGNRRSGSPLDYSRQNRLGKPVYAGSHADSVTPTNERLSRHLSNSYGNLLESTRDDMPLILRNVISPPPDTRNRSMTVSHPGITKSASSMSTMWGPKGQAEGQPGGQIGGPPGDQSKGQADAGNHERVDSFGDYEMMESVSILKDSPSLRTRQSHSPSPQPSPYHSPYSERRPMCKSAGNTLNRPHEKEGMRYAESTASAGNTLNRPHDKEGMRYAESASAGNTLTRPRERENVKYAEIRYPKSGGPGVIINPTSTSVNYAEVRFARSNTVSTPSQQPHPFALYDTVPPGRREATPPKAESSGPYQSRADLLAHRLQPDSAHPAPNTMSRRPASARSATNYATIQFPLRNPAPTNGHAPTSASSSPYSHIHSMHSHTSSTNSSPSLHASSSLHSHTSDTNPAHFVHGSPAQNTSTVPGSQTSSSHIPITQTDHILYALPNKSRLSTRSSDISTSNDSLLSAASSNNSASPAHKHVMGSSLVHSHAPASKVHKSLPGYEALVKVHTLLQNHSDDELAYHMTRTDAVCFMLAPRPAEDQEVWADRVKQVTSSSGVFCGLQTLADPDGEKLWKKLYFRHLNLSQTVTLTIITAGDALERCKLLHRYIHVAKLLQSERYGNLFSFIGVMQGLATPQLADMTEVWKLLNSQFPDEAATYKDLQGIFATLNTGEAVLSYDHLAIPPIQHLKAIFNFTEQNMIGFGSAHPDHSVVGEYTNVTSGLASLRDIVAHTASFTVNAWKHLEGLQYNVNLMEFLMQDFTRVYLQAINVNSDSPMERRRRFGLLMDALMDRVESNESV